MIKLKQITIRFKKGGRYTVYVPAWMKKWVDENKGDFPTGTYVKMIMGSVLFKDRLTPDYLLELAIQDEIKRRKIPKSGIIREILERYFEENHEKG